MTRHVPLDAFGVVTTLLGFRPEPTRSADVELAVRDRLRRRSVDSLEAYASLLEDETARAVEARALADRLTVNETYFFREHAHHAILKDFVLPEHRARGTSPLRILSIGCSSGEEPYGVAIKLHELGMTRADVRIVAIDASAAAIARAERAEFSPWSLRNVNEEIRRRYFTRLRGDAFALSEEIRPWVRFSVRNLLDPDRSFFEPDSYDVVFCRNVLIYFTPDVVRGVIATIASVLRPGGTLFLGHAETMHAGRLFTTHEGHGGFYFTKRDPRAPERRRIEDHIAMRETPIASPRPRRGETPKSGERPLSSGSEPPNATLSVVRDEDAEGPGIERCIAHMRAERFDEALATLDALTTRSSASEIIRAALLTNKGEVALAREACGRVLGDRASNAEAHYLLGLCDELEQRTDSARQHYTRAVALDEDFAIPRMRLGILLRKSRSLADARRLLGDALRLFPHQSDRTLLIFGGGFNADALTRLCRTELDACKKT